MANKYLGENALRQLWTNVENKIEAEVANIDISSSESLNIPICNTYHYSSSEGNYEIITHQVDWNDAYQMIAINQTSDIENSWLSNYYSNNEISNAGFVNLSVLNSGGKDYEISLPDINYVRYMINNNIENADFLSNYISQSDFYGVNTYNHIAFIPSASDGVDLDLSDAEAGLYGNMSYGDNAIWRRFLTTDDLSEIYTSMSNCIQDDSSRTYETILSGIAFDDNTVRMINPSNDNTYELLTASALSVSDADSKAYLSYNYYSFPDISYVDYQIGEYLIDNSYISESDLSNHIGSYLADNSYISASDLDSYIGEYLTYNSYISESDLNLDNRISEYLTDNSYISESNIGVFVSNESLITAIGNYLLSDSGFTNALASIING